MKLPDLLPEKHVIIPLRAPDLGTGIRSLIRRLEETGTIAAADEEPGDRPVREIMARSVLCVFEDLGINEVASMMVNKDVEQIPVVNAGAMTGLVSRADIIRKLFGRG